MRNASDPSPMSSVTVQTGPAISRGRASFGAALSISSPSPPSGRTSSSRTATASCASSTSRSSARSRPAWSGQTTTPGLRASTPPPAGPIWHDNVLFASPRTDETGLPPDDEVVTQVGEFLARLTALSAVVPEEIPWGPATACRMASITFTAAATATAASCSSPISPTYQPPVIRTSSRSPPLRARSLREVSSCCSVAASIRRVLPYFSCCMRGDAWFCNSNGPRKRDAVGATRLHSPPRTSSPATGSATSTSSSNPVGAGRGPCGDRDQPLLHRRRGKSRLAAHRSGRRSCWLATLAADSDARRARRPVLRGPPPVDRREA